MIYPNSKKEMLIENIYGIDVEDSYRWMEDEANSHLSSWIDEQNSVTQKYLDDIEEKTAIEDELNSLFDYAKYDSVRVIGDYIIYAYNDGLQNQSVFYIQKGVNGQSHVLIDPNSLSDDGTVAIHLNGHSKDNKYLSFLQSSAGSDWQHIKVIDLDKRTLLDDCLEWVKFTLTSWQDDGFYYSAFDAPEKNKVLSHKNTDMKVYYHKIGTEQAEDRLVYKDSENPLRYHTVMVSEDQEALILSSREGTYGSEIKLSSKNTGHKFRKIFSGFDTKQDYIGSIKDDLFFVTDENCQNKKLVKINTRTHQIETVIESSDLILQGAHLIKNKLIVLYLEDVNTLVKIFDCHGTFENDLKLPFVGTPFEFTSSDAFDEIFYGFTSYIQPTAFYNFSLEHLTSHVFKSSKVNYNVEDYVTEQIFSKSKDGTLVPAYVSYKKGLKLTGDNPTMLYAYGGFNIPIKPNYKPGVIYLLERGGIHVEANIRGGSEYGEKWHKGGMLLNKQNVFDDFIAVAENLIDKGYTSKNHLAISGRSNGGLLMGVLLNQRPDLFSVVFPAVGVMDMMRYHRFTIGWGWVVEYGNPEEEIHFNNIIKYSPLHNIEKKDYPAVMVFTADHDDRVVPAHSFKYIAKLQEDNTSDNPMLIRIDKNSGHGAGKSIAKQIAEETDKYAFMFKHIEG